MKQVLLLVLALMTSISLNAQLTQHTLTIGTTNRSYFKYLPTNYQSSENLPVVFILHGLGGNAQQMTSAGFNLIADTARIIAIYPDGRPNAFGQNSWNNGTGLSSTVNDLLFFNTMMDEMITNQNANPARIYVTGFSMGGIMSHHLACQINNRIAAIGPMAGTMATSNIATCVPVYKTPVIHLHGTADLTVPYNSNALPTLSLVPQTMDFWINVHGCSSTADSTRIPDTANDGLTIDRFVYDNCDITGAVELWRINGAGHIYLFEPLNDITEAKEIWKFFYRWQHPNPSVLSVSETSKSKVFSVSPNPSNGKINISSNGNTTLEFVDINGKVLQTIFVSTGETTLNLKATKGIYFLRDDNGLVQRLVIQ